MLWSPIDSFPVTFGQRHKRQHFTFHSLVSGTCQTQLRMKKASTNLLFTVHKRKSEQCRTTGGRERRNGHRQQHQVKANNAKNQTLFSSSYTIYVPHIAIAHSQLYVSIEPSSLLHMIFAMKIVWNSCISDYMKKDSSSFLFIARSTAATHQQTNSAISSLFYCVWPHPSVRIIWKCFC